MNASSSAIVLCAQTHPAAQRLRATRAARACAPVAWTRTQPVPDLGPSLEVESRLARRRAQRSEHRQAASLVPRTLRFSAFLRLPHRLWRRWRRGLALSRLCCAPAQLLDPPLSPSRGFAVSGRSRRPAGTHPSRDLSARVCRRRPGGRDA